MPDNIERTIYKLELDGSGYITGVDNIVGAQRRLADAVNITNTRLIQSQKEYNNTTGFVVSAQKELANYTGTSKTYREQLEKDISKGTDAQEKANQKVVESQKAYDLARKAAFDYAAATQKAANVKAESIPVGAPGVDTGSVSKLINNIDTLLSGPVELNNKLLSVSDQFNLLGNAINQADEQLQQLDKTSDEFKALSPVVEQAKVAMDNYKKAAESGGLETKSLRQQILEYRKALDTLQATGKADDATVTELTKKIAHLTEKYREQTEMIRVLSSESRVLDFGKSSIRAAIAGFEALTAVQILSGGSSEELEKKTMQLFAAMQLLNAMEELHELTKKGSVINTNLQAAAQVTYNFVVNASTVALKAFRVALIGTGIGAAIVLITTLIAKWEEYSQSVKDATERQKDLEDLNKKTIEGYTKEEVHLELIKAKLNDHNISMKKRVELAKQYNEESDKQFRIDTTKLNNEEAITDAINRQIEAIKSRAKAKAIEDILVKKNEDLFLAQQKAREEVLQKEERGQKARDQRISENLKRPASTESNNPSVRVPDEMLAAGLLDVANKKRQVREDTEKKLDEEHIQAIVNVDKEVVRSKAEVEYWNKLASENIKVDDLIKPDTKKDKKNNENRNVFKEERDKLLNDLKLLRLGEIEGISKINSEFEKKLEDERIRVQKLIDSKRLTGTIDNKESQAGIIFDLQVQVDTAKRDAALKDFNKKIVENRKQLDRELIALDEANAEASLNLIEDEFKRRSELINFNEAKDIEAIKNGRDDRLSDLLKELHAELISQAEYQIARQKIVEDAEIAVNNVVRKYGNERMVLAQDMFQKLVNAYVNAITDADLLRSQKLSGQIQELNKRFNEGKIGYNRFLKEIKKLKEDHDRDMKEGDLVVMQSESEELQRQLDSMVDKYSDAYKKIEKQKKDLDARIANTQISIASTDPKEEDKLKRIKEFEKYTSAVGQFAQAVISFWEQGTKAEQAALDRSISIQERRVNEAQKLADRGNATYLKAETDKMKKLQIAKENAARRELAINAALQASQVLVAITGAVAKIAEPGAGVADVIASVAVIVASLAAGYGIVKSLSAQQPKFKKGTTEVQQGKHPTGIDTIPAWLTAGEAVIPVEKNQEYKKSVEAIYHGKVPAPVLNQFVENYVKGRNTEDIMNIVTTVSKPQANPLPSINVQRIKESAEHRSLQDSRLAKIMSEQNSLLRESNELNRQTVRALKSIGVNVNIDRNGLALSLMETAEREKIQKRV